MGAIGRGDPHMDKKTWKIAAWGKKFVHNRCFLRGVAKLVKAPDFDSGMRGFESFLPCQIQPC